MRQGATQSELESSLEMLFICLLEKSSYPLRALRQDFYPRSVFMCELLFDGLWTQGKQEYYRMPIVLLMYI